MNDSLQNQILLKNEQPKNEHDETWKEKFMKQNEITNQLQQKVLSVQSQNTNLFDTNDKNVEKILIDELSKIKQKNAIYDDVFESSCISIQ